MSRRSHPWPAAHPSVETIALEIPGICAQLHRAGVPAQDREDILQEIMIGAVKAIRADRYRPAPHLDPRRILRAWLAGIAYRQISRYRKRPHRRREVLCGVPEGADLTTPAPSAEAWDALRALAVLRPDLLAVIRLEALGWQVKEIAVHLAIPIGTATTRLRTARKRIRRAGGR